MRTKLYAILAFGLFVIQIPACFGDGPHSNSNSLLIFGTDIPAHFDPEKADLNNDISVAFNGWIYVAYSTIHSDPSGVDIGLAVSKDNGLSWQEFSPGISGSHNAATVFDLLVTGNDTNSLRVYLSYSFTDAAFSYPFGHVNVYDGLSGASLSFGIDIGDGTYNIGDVRLCSDFNHPSSGSSGYSIAISYTTGSGDFTQTDSLVCIIASDKSKNTFDYYLVDSSSLFSLRGATIDYGFSPSSNDGIFFIAYQKGSKIAYCRNSIANGAGFTIPVLINDIAGISDGALDSSKIVCQNSMVSNDSSGLSVMIVTKALDSTGTNTYSIPMIFYNMQSALTDYWTPTVIGNSDLSVSTYDASFSENENRFFIAGYNSDSASLFLRMEDFNFSHAGNWYNVESQYNDSVIDPKLQPNPRIAVNNNFVFSAWESRIKGITGLPRSQTLFDKLSLPIITKLDPDIITSSYIIYPVPANNELTIYKKDNFSNVKSINIFDQLGRNVFLKTFNSGIETINLNISELKNGFYILQIESKNGVSEKRKILIRHF